MDVYCFCFLDRRFSAKWCLVADSYITINNKSRAYVAKYQRYWHPSIWWMNDIWLQTQSMWTHPSDLHIDFEGLEAWHELLERAIIISSFHCCAPFIVNDQVTSTVDTLSQLLNYCSNIDINCAQPYARMNFKLLTLLQLLPSWNVSSW